MGMGNGKGKKKQQVAIALAGKLNDIRGEGFKCIADAYDALPQVAAKAGIKPQALAVLCDGERVSRDGVRVG